MSIRVGRCKYIKGKRIDPTYPGYIPVVVLMKSHSKWWRLSPYYLTDDEDRIFENIWQFSKVYQKVPRTIQRYSRYDSRIIWDHPEETHVDHNGNLLPAYHAWRNAGMSAPYAIRYPVGTNARHTCMHSYKDGEPHRQLDYIDSRKKIYLREYNRLVQREPQFQELKDMLAAGKKILIIEVDAPHSESLQYYKDNYGTSDDFIDRDSMEATETNLKVMLNDPLHPFGHGYCLAWALCDYS
jgi:hypothetical protein